MQDSDATFSHGLAQLLEAKAAASPFKPRF
jgi:hypothetical protein